MNIKKLPLDASSIDWSGRTFLLVEDEEANHLLIASYLKKTGVKLIWARDGREAIDMVVEYPELSLVLMDIKLPELDGYEATRQIKSLRPDLPVIAQTAYVMANEKGLVLQAGCDDLIIKPIRLNELLASCLRYIGKKG